MVQEVEGLKSELDIPLLGEVEILQRGEVPSEDTWADSHVAAGVAETSERLEREGVDVKPLSRRRVAKRRVDAGRVGAVVAVSGLGSVGARYHGQRESTRDRNDRVQFPAANHAAGDAFVEVLAALSERQVVDHRSNKAVKLVEDREAALARQAVDVLRKQGVGAESTNATAVVDGFRKSVARKDRQTICVAPRQLNGERMVIGVGGINRSLGRTAELGEWVALCKRRRARKGPV